ncbi:diguanylate cyclase [[Bacillus] sp. KCTC 13219]|nr:diguanylate cyclase [[Bacillus] sp. KCTC 13219]
MVYIGEMAEQIMSVEPTNKNKIIDQHFTKDQTLRGLVVTDKRVPIAYISRTHFYEKIGTLYGYNLYMGRESKLIAKSTPLIVDFYKPIMDVSTLAMARSPEDLYDDIIVTKDGNYLGVVSIRTLLLKLVDIQVEFASLLNPLSHLPGNQLIDEKLNEILNYEQYSILYFDIDHFKMYNDVYGFKKGDEVLLFMTDLLKQYVLPTNGFLGHIGGDDFVAICTDYDIEEMCARIISDFDQQIIHFYDQHHFTDDAFSITNRSGERVPFQISTLSIAVVNNRFTKYEFADALSDAVAKVKSECKKFQGSCYIVNGHVLQSN